MKITRTRNLLAAALVRVVVFAATGEQAQTRTLETRIGKITTEVGTPTKDSVTFRKCTC